MSSSKIIEVTLERAYELAGQLYGKTAHQTSAIQVFSGNHPDLGDVHIVIPPLGDAVILPALLPVVIQNFSL